MRPFRTGQTVYNKQRYGRTGHDFGHRGGGSLVDKDNLQ